MKTTFISLIALGIAAVMAGPADRALADEPMVLTNAQLDQVTAARGHAGTFVVPHIVLAIGKLGATPSTPDNVNIAFDPPEGETILQLELNISIPEHPIPDKDHKGWSDVSSFSHVVHRLR